MIVSIHQPQYLPWIPYFTKIAQSDIFIFLDDVQFQKNGLQNRNYIYGKNKETRLTIPVNTSLSTEIRSVKIANAKILRKHWKTIEQTYKKASAFKEIEAILKPIYYQQYQFISKLNTDLITCILKYLEIPTKIKRSSSIEKVGRKSELILSICQKIGATTYLTGAGGMNYLDTDNFTKNNIKIELLKYSFKEYTQFTGNQLFVPHLSILDVLFNEGKNSIQYIEQNNKGN